MYIPNRKTGCKNHNDVDNDVSIKLCDSHCNDECMKMFLKPQQQPNLIEEDNRLNEVTVFKPYFESFFKTREA